VRLVWHSEYGLERWTMLALLVLRLATPFIVFSHVWLSRWPLRRRKVATELYCCVRLIVLALLLYAVTHGWRGAVYGTAYLLFDLLVGLLGGVFLNRPRLYGRPVSVTRSILLALVNYWEINLAFATFY